MLFASMTESGRLKVDFKCSFTVYAKEHLNLPMVRTSWVQQMAGRNNSFFIKGICFGEMLEQVRISCRRLS